MLKIIISIIMVTFIWGYLWVPMKIRLNYMPPFLFTALRLLIGAIPLFIVQAVRKTKLFPKKADWGKLIIMSTLMCLGYYGLSTFGMQFVSSGLSSVLVYTMPIIISEPAHYFLNERLTAKKTTGFVSGAIGLFIIIGPQIKHLSFDRTVLGEGLIVLAAFFWACA